MNSTDPAQAVRLGLARATLALLDGDERLADLAAHTPDADSADLRRIGAVTAELALLAQQRAPKRAIPDRLHSTFRSIAREADTLIETAATARPVDLDTMHHLVDDLVGRVQINSRRLSAKESRRALRVAQLYATIADHAAAMSRAMSSATPRVAA